jgi:drug/metabolite transporter (DMT)-like permease
MSVDVFVMVLGAAFVHATWNALIKIDDDRLSLIKVMSSTQIVLSLCLLPFVSVPAAESWPYLLASPILNTGYMLFLNRAYQSGDLSLVYPLARGIAPLIVAVVSVGLLGEQLSRASQIAILLIALGITSLALTRGAATFRDLRPVLLALTTGGFIAGYTIIDGIGARAAGTAHGYMIWISLLTAVLIVGCVQWLQQGHRAPVSRRSRGAGIVAGIMSYGSSWLVIWALTLAPLALVSALRETGIVFAVIIGVVCLKERLNLARLASIATTLVGTTILKLGR